MAKQASIRKNFIMNSILTMSSFIFPMITFPYVSRILGPENYGRVGMATSLVSYFAMFAQLGILFTRKYVILIIIGLACIFCYRAF